MTDINLSPDDDKYKAVAAGDRIFGLAGNDTITATDGGNELFGGDGNDTLKGGDGDDYLAGDSSTNEDFHNVLLGGGGNDHIVSYSWQDEINAGSGDDKVEVFALRTGQVVNGGGGTDTISLRALQGISDPVSITFGSNFAPIVAGINGATYTGFEILNFTGGTGENIITGGNGDDFIFNSNTNVSAFDAGSISGGRGNDRLGFSGLPTTGTGTEQIDGGKGNDTLTWSNGFANFNALTVDAGAGTFENENGVLANFASIENLTVSFFFGFTGTIDFTGGAGIDTLGIWASQSDLDLKGGDDSVVVNSGSATIDAGSGNDAISVASSGVVHGGDGNDLLSGGQGQSVFHGEDGNDTLSTSNGKTSLYGGNGDDALSMSRSSILGTGPATLDGGSGRDTLSLELSSFGAAFTADFSKPNVTLADGTIVVRCEAITFTASNSGNDVLKSSNDAAGQTANKLLGIGGNDTLTAAANGATLDGGLGDDTLIGGDGADKLLGSFGVDTLNGKAGADSLTGGSGKDKLTGGLDADSFVFTFLSEIGNDAATRDVIADFTQAELDKVDVSFLDADQITTGNQEFTFIGSGGFGNHAGELRYQKFNNAGSANDYTLISGDLNGDGTGDFQIEVTGLVNLAAGDFVL